MPNSIPVLVEQHIVAFALGFLGYGRRTSPASCGDPSGAASRSRPTASKACCAGRASAPGRCATACWPATRPHPSRPASPSPSATSRSLVPASSCRWTATASAAGGHQGRRLAACGDRCRERLHLGRAARDAEKAPTHASPQSSPTVWRLSWPRRAGAWRACLHRQRLRVPQPRLRRRACQTGNRAHADQPRPAAVERLRRARAAHDPRRVLEALVRLLPGAQVHGLRRELERHLRLYNHDRAHNGRLTNSRIPAEVLGADKMWR
jgi:hypothetical protein